MAPIKATVSKRLTPQLRCFWTRRMELSAFIFSLLPGQIRRQPKTFLFRQTCGCMRAIVTAEAVLILHLRTR